MLAEMGLRGGDRKSKTQGAFLKLSALGIEHHQSQRWQREAELTLRAERKAGTMLAEMGLRGGDRRSNFHDGSLKLADLGIGYTDSHRWQQEAELSDALFEAYITTTREMGKELTS